MTERHLSAELFRRFLAREITADESKRIIRHLLRGCVPCAELVGRIVEETGHWFPKRGAGATAEEYEVAFEAAQRFATEKQRREAVARLVGWGQWASLDGLVPEERVAVVVGDKQFHHWGFFHALLDAARRYSFTDPREAVDVVQLAITVGDFLDAAEAGGQPAAMDLRAKAWAILGNARRLASDLDGARQALNEAWRLHEEGTHDGLEKALLLSIDASWIKATGEFETAEAALSSALDIYEEAGDFHMQGRTLLQMGDAIGHANPLRGIVHIRRALGLINTTKEPRLELCAQHDLAWFLVDAGQPEEALAILDRARALYKQFPDDWTQLRLHWLEARIARGLERLVEAAHIFRQVWEEFRAREMNFPLVIVSIELAETMVESGEYDRAARLVAEVYPIMAQWHLHRNALAAWLLLQKALELGQVDDLFARIQLYYRRFWLTPAEFPAREQ